MAIRIKFGNVVYLVDTPEEAVRIGSLLDGQGPKRPAKGRTGVIGGMMASADDAKEWTPELFHQFIERLGDTQRAILSILVEHGQVSDQHLRERLNIPGNQALAGALSGISKQAVALGISARSVFTFENLRRAGKRQSLYAPAQQFRQIAVEVGPRDHRAQGGSKGA
jgi:hypothetical protein